MFPFDPPDQKGDQKGTLGSKGLKSVLISEAATRSVL